MLIRGIFGMWIYLKFTSRLPLTPLGFEIAVILDLWFCFVYIMVSLTFAAIYLSAYNNIQACYNDISLLVTRSNENIAQNISIKGTFNQFFDLHLHCYR